MFLIIIGCVFINDIAQSKSIDLGDQIKLILSDSDSTKIEGTFFRAENDTIGIRNISGQKFFNLENIAELRTHRTFSTRPIFNGAGIGSLVGGGLGFFAIGTDKNVDYLKIVGAALVGGWLGGFIGGIIGENVVLKKNNLYISYDKLSATPKWLESIKCGDELKVYTLASTVPIRGHLYAKDSAYIIVENDEAGPQMIKHENIYEAYLVRSNAKRKMTLGLGLGSIVGLSTGLAYYLTDQQHSKEDAKLSDALPIGIFTVAGGLIGALIGVSLGSNDEERIKVDFLRSIPDCKEWTNNNRNELQFGLYLLIK